MVPATSTSQPRNLKSTPLVFPCIQFHSSTFPFIQKKKKKKKREKRKEKKKKKKRKKSNKKLNTEAGTLRVNHVSYDTDTDLITK